jgi:hypothetical protein
MGLKASTECVDIASTECATKLKHSGAECVFYILRSSI